MMGLRVEEESEWVREKTEEWYIALKGGGGGRLRGRSWGCIVCRGGFAWNWVANEATPVPLNKASPSYDDRQTDNTKGKMLEFGRFYSIFNGWLILLSTNLLIKEFKI